LNETEDIEEIKREVATLKEDYQKLREELDRCWAVAMASYLESFKSG
jgi:hypothetical protein